MHVLLYECLQTLIPCRDLCVQPFRCFDTLWSHGLGKLMLLQCSALVLLLYTTPVELCRLMRGSKAVLQLLCKRSLTIRAVQQQLSLPTGLPASASEMYSDAHSAEIAACQHHVHELIAQGRAAPATYGLNECMHAMQRTSNTCSKSWRLGGRTSSPRSAV